MDSKQEVTADRRKAQEVAKRKKEHDKYRFLLDEVGRLEDELRVARRLGESFETLTIKPKERSRTSEATVIVLASDWHLEERVRHEEVSGLNRYNLAIAEQRVTQFFRGALRLWQITRKDVSIKTIVLALLGDAISGNIHEELLATCQLGPVEAILKAQSLIVSGIKFLLDKTDCELVIPCCVGN